MVISPGRFGDITEYFRFGRNRHIPRFFYIILILMANIDLKRSGILVANSIKIDARFAPEKRQGTGRGSGQL